MIYLLNRIKLWEETNHEILLEYINGKKLRGIIEVLSGDRWA